MVKVREAQPELPDGEVDLEAWLGRLTEHVEITDEDGLLDLCEWARELELETPEVDNRWADSASSFRTGLEMAEILAELHLDTDALKAAVIYRAVREGQVTLAEVAVKAGTEIAHLIEGVLQMAAISAVMNPEKKVVLGQSSSQVDNLRKMLVAMVDDVRVALIKLAERTCAIRAVKEVSEAKRQRVAKEIFDIYAPLAHRLGIGHIKWELEDLSFRYLHPSAYRKIARLLDGKRLDREQYIKNVIQMLKEALAKAGIEAEITGRAKHIYSIWRKMRRKGIDFYHVYDIRAVRVLVPEIRDCYEALGIVHEIWQYIPNEFDDYIARPKENGYRSLHTAVIGPEGKIMEVQIRTHQMHDESELGVCAHWRYKEGSRAKGDTYDDKIAWLRQVLEWQEELGDSGISSMIAQFSEDVLDERVYVFTPDGHVVDLAQGATPLDFAYHIHTEVGHGCRGAKVNGRIVPLSYQLSTGEQVEIIKGNRSQPSRDWLNPSLGYLGTARARAKVQAWFKRQDRDQNIADGRAILDKELARLDLTRISLERIVEALNLKTTDDLLAAVGAGDLRLPQVLNAIQSLDMPAAQQEELPLDIRKPLSARTIRDIEVEGESNLLTSLAGCCKPVPGDKIVGYISLGRGISVHRADCRELAHLQEQDPQRLVHAKWGKPEKKQYSADIFISAHDRQGLLRDITNILAQARINVLGLQTSTDRLENTATMTLTIEVASLTELGNVLARIGQLSHVIEARRCSH
jgi:GTP pyrophosphokinase